MKVKILIVTPYGQDAHSFWRCIGPMSYLAKYSGGDIEIQTMGQVQGNQEKVTWAELATFDIIFLHRPCRPDDLTVIQMARNLNIPTWMDLDDWLFDIPLWNPNAGTYHTPGIQTIMAHCIATADVVSCSTSALYDQFKKLNPNVVIVPNAYRSDLFTYREMASDLPRKPIFVWRGTNTHDGDIMSVASAFPSLSGKVHFLGSPPWSITRMMQPEQYQTLTHQDTLLYWKYIYGLAPKVFLVPLHDCFFNRAKSNIAYIEAMHAGAICVAPDLPEWRRPGVVTYDANDAQSFLACANHAIEMLDWEHHDMVSQAFIHMKELYDISIVNQIRIEIVKSMIDAKFERNKRDPYDQLTAIWALSRLKNTPMIEVNPETLKMKNLVSQ